jgi:hypothetical protein
MTSSSLFRSLQDLLALALLKSTAQVEENGTYSKQQLEAAASLIRPSLGNEEVDFFAPSASNARKFLSEQGALSDDETDTPLWPSSDEDQRKLQLNEFLRSQGFALAKVDVIQEKQLVLINVDRETYTRQTLVENERLADFLLDCDWSIPHSRVQPSKWMPPLTMLRMELANEVIHKIGEFKKWESPAIKAEELNQTHCDISVACVATKKGKDERSLLSAYKEAFDFFLASAEERLGGTNHATAVVNAHKLASAHMRLCLLGRESSKTCSVTGGMQDTAFVMYNYARLLSILRAFEAQDYPAPCTTNNAMDLSALLGDGEWRLTFVYISRFPDVVSKGPHSLVRFLHDLSRSLSKWYRVKRVLVEPLPHLLPAIWAHIKFVKALKTIYEVSFSLLSIQRVITL